MVDDDPDPDPYPEATAIMVAAADLSSPDGRRFFSLFFLVLVASPALKALLDLTISGINPVHVITVVRTR